MALRPLKRADSLSEQFPSAILDSLSEAVVVVDGSGLIHYANLSAEQFFWRPNCFYGSMMYVRANNGRVARLVSETAAGSTDTLQREQLLDFVEAGFRSPSSTAKN